MPGHLGHDPHPPAGTQAERKGDPRGYRFPARGAPGQGTGNLPQSADSGFLGNGAQHRTTIRHRPGRRQSGAHGIDDAGPGCRDGKPVALIQDTGHEARREMEPIP